MLRRYARDLGRWLGGEVRRRSIARVAVFAAAPILGALRRECPGELLERIEEHRGDLGALGLSELGRHPAVAGVLGRTATR